MNIFPNVVHFFEIMKRKTMRQGHGRSFVLVLKNENVESEGGKRGRTIRESESELQRSPKSSFPG